MIHYTALTDTERERESIGETTIATLHFHTHTYTYNVCSINVEHVGGHIEIVLKSAEC